MTTLITGGAGFLGRSILSSGVETDNFVVLSRDETKHEALRRRFPGVRTVIGDIRDAALLEPLMAGIDTVIHAAAIKYVDFAEENVAETIGVNVHGTSQVLAAAARAGVKAVVVVSTDKATAPLNTYGATKQLGERLVGEYAARWPNTRFVACRYGNVVGSTGSVTWKWHQAITRGDALTMTDPAMTRFWMSAAQAVTVVRDTLRHPSGTVTIPRCAAMAMGDVAKAMGADAIQTIGVRPGERRYEMLLSPEEAPRAVRDGAYMILQPAYIAGRADGQQGYSSAVPDVWLEADEMRQYVEEARALW